MSNELFMALIRGINVGKANRIAMSDLKALCHDLGFKNTLSILNSGNLIFEAESGSSKSPGEALEVGIRERFGIETGNVILSRGHFQAILEDIPAEFDTCDPSKTLVAIPQQAFDATETHSFLSEHVHDPERLWIGHHGLYLDCPSGIHKSRLVQQVDRFFKKAITSRNLKTIERIRTQVVNWSS